MKIKNLLSYTEEERRIRKVVLPNLAGIPSKRKRIGYKMMDFLKSYGHLYYNNYRELSAILYEIGLQRISCGPVMHPDDRLPTYNALPKPYRMYASKSGDKGCYPEGMDEHDEQFLYTCLEDCVNLEATRTHALAICFGLVRYLEPNGLAICHYVLGTNKHNANGQRLYKMAMYLINKYATQEEIMCHWATPRQWSRHKRYFAYLAREKKLDWANFFKTTHLCQEDNFFKRCAARKRFKEELKRSS